MDFNLKTKSLAGHLYEQFESLCRDIDEFVNEDTVKFVENQVQTVKKMYSNVVQVLPHSGDCVKHKLLEEDGEKHDMCDHLSNTDTVTEDKLYLSQDSLHIPSVRDSGVPIEDQVSEDEAESNLHLEEYSNVMIQNGEESGVYDSTPATGRSSLDNESFDNESFLNFMGVSNEDHKFSTPSSPALRAHEEGLTAINFSDDSGLKTVEDPYSDENGNLSSLSATRDCEVNVDERLLMDSPPSSCDANADDSVVEKDSALDNNVIQTADIVRLLENTHKQHNRDYHSEVVMSSETANMIEVSKDDAADLDTIDLSPDVKDDGKSVLPNIVCGDHAPSHRVKNFRYYQKLIREAFSSRKRLAKEYEQLGILYGDIDMESKKHFEPSFAPSFPSMANNATKTQSSQELCETEWELL